jgi:hypothetical protein
MQNILGCFLICEANIKFKNEFHNTIMGNTYIQYTLLKRPIL